MENLWLITVKEARDIVIGTFRLSELFSTAKPLAPERMVSYTSRRSKGYLF